MAGLVQVAVLLLGGGHNAVLDLAMALLVRKYHVGIIETKLLGKFQVEKTARVTERAQAAGPTAPLRCLCQLAMRADRVLLLFAAPFLCRAWRLWWRRQLHGWWR